MTKVCAKCEFPIRDGDDIVAVIVSVFRSIPSSKAYAIDKPTECLEIQHYGCSDITEDK